MPSSWRSNYSRYQSYFLNIVALYKKRPDLQAFLEILLSLGAIALFAGLALRPTLLTIAQLLKDIEAKESTIAKIEEKIANLNSAQSVLSANTAKVALLPSAIPGQPSPESFTRQMEGLAARSGVTFVGLTFAETSLVGPQVPAKVEEGQAALPSEAAGVAFSANFSAPSYQAIADFARNLENLRRPLVVDTFTLNTTLSEEGQKSLVLLVSGRIPYEKP